MSSELAPRSTEPERRAPITVLAGGGVQPYRRLAEIFHDVLSEESLDALLERIADALAELVPYEAVHIHEADEANRWLKPAFARSEWAAEIMRGGFPFRKGITGWAVQRREPVLANKAHLDPRVRFVPGTPAEPEALIVVPLVARGRLNGTLNVYRWGRTRPSPRRSSCSPPASGTPPRSPWTTPTSGRGSSTRSRPTP